MNMDKINKIHSKINYPSYLNGTILSKDVVLSIANKHLNLIKYINSNINPYRNKSHESISNSLRSLDNCWRGVIYYANGGRSWDSCQGVNNPYLMGNATIK